MQKHTQYHDDTQHEHVLAGPFHLAGLVGHGIAAVTACPAVLQGEDESKDEMQGHQDSQTDGCCNSIPVGTQELTNHVVTLSTDEGYDVH